jgi:hypothetical protein
MAEITLHNGTKMDSAELIRADFYEAGSSTGARIVGEDGPLVYQEDELVLVFKDGSRKDPIKGEDARKDLSALEAAHVRIIYHWRL